MKVELIGNLKTVMSNPHSHHGYFAWPTLAKLQDGRLAVGASGFRVEHVCPFGKSVISYSSDGGETYTLPAPVIDTPLDDRDAGICTFGEKGVIFTTFNNSAQMQRGYNKDNAYVQSYIDTITPEDEEKYLGALFRISNDCGLTFGEIYHSPITSPHGPIQLRDGTVMWAGTRFDDIFCGIEVRLLDTESGETELIGKITSSDKNVVLNEPHMVELPNGRLICHIRGENAELFDGGDEELFTVFQSVSDDGGRTWSEPVMLLDKTGGAPPHLLLLKSGLLLSTYGRRKQPYGIMAMISADGGETWQTDIPICENLATDDLGYPSTVELDDGILVTVFYASEGEDLPCNVLQQKWKNI
ncbi:MAG: exo-alpha-sialidase [Ruminococcaceae bacterium]|nr:exo-alpha-sialidase [Oscillospiraceae bacterium]